MAVAVIGDIPAGTEHQYEQVIGEVFAEGKPRESWLGPLAGRAMSLKSADD